MVVHENMEKSLLFTCDVLLYGVKAVLSYLQNDRHKADTTYYPQTMNKTERNYAQIDREALADTAGVKKFHDYI